MKITEITLGVMEAGIPRAFQLRPNEGVTLAGTGAVDPALVAAALRDTLAEPTRGGAAEIPFVRIALESAGRRLEIVDDAAQGVRMLIEPDLEQPRIAEATMDDDAELEAILARVAAAAGIDHLGAALATVGVDETPEATADERAYVEATERAKRLAAAVRNVDDRMTASVVPDWLWVATGFGGVGVLLTAVVLSFPGSRIYVIPALLGLSVVGFGMYGWRSARELRLRGELQAERADLRAQREAARAEAKAHGMRLAEAGLDPAAATLRLAKTVALDAVPALVTDRGAAGPSDRQIIIFVRDPGDSPHRLDLMAVEPRATE